VAIFDISECFPRAWRFSCGLKYGSSEVPLENQCLVLIDMATKEKLLGEGSATIDAA
jgi:hypothetical protein